jgi:hypothetical protein
MEEESTILVTDKFCVLTSGVYQCQYSVQYMTCSNMQNTLLFLKSSQSVHQYNITRNNETKVTDMLELCSCHSAKIYENLCVQLFLPAYHNVTDRFILVYEEMLRVQKW